MDLNAIQSQPRLRHPTLDRPRKPLKAKGTDSSGVVATPAAASAPVSIKNEANKPLTELADGTVTGRTQSAEESTPKKDDVISLRIMLPSPNTLDQQHETRSQN